jgi:hypothetical protein
MWSWQRILLNEFFNCCAAPKCKDAGQRGAPRYLGSPIHGAPNINAKKNEIRSPHAAMPPRH